MLSGNYRQLYYKRINSESSGGFRGHPHGPKFSQFHAVFSENFDKIVCWRLGGLAPLLRKFLDPPLERISHLVMFYNIIFSAKRRWGNEVRFLFGPGARK